jgi:hypothetical protein
VYDAGPVKMTASSDVDISPRLMETGSPRDNALLDAKAEAEAEAEADSNSD